VFERSLAGTLNDRTIGKRIAEGDTELNHARTRVNSRQDDLTCGRKIRVTAGHVCDEGGSVFEVKGHERPL
jgi:hypothetical protein